MSAGLGIVSANYIVPATKDGIISIGRAKCPAPQAADELASKTYVDTAVSGSAAVTAFESFDLPMYRGGPSGDVIATPHCTVTSTGGAAELYVPRFSFVAPQGAIAIQSSNYAIPINFTAAYPTTICTFVSDSTAHQDWIPFLVQMGLNRGITIYPLSGSLVSGDTYNTQPFSMPFILEAFQTVPVTFSNGLDSSFSVVGFALHFGRQAHFTFNTVSFTGNAAAPTASTALPAAILPINTVTCYAIASVGDEGTKSPVSMQVGADGTLTFHNPSAIDGLFLLVVQEGNTATHHILPETEHSSSTGSSFCDYCNLYTELPLVSVRVVPCNHIVSFCGTCMVNLRHHCTQCAIGDTVLFSPMCPTCHHIVRDATRINANRLY